MLRIATFLVLYLISPVTLAFSLYDLGAFYLGVGLGPSFANFKQETTVQIPTLIDVKNTTRLSGTGLFGTFLGGYAITQGQFYLAAEGNLDYNTTKFKTSNDEFFSGTSSHTSYKITHNYGVSIVPGYLFRDWVLFYARAGYVLGHFKNTTTDPALSISKDLSGFRYGFGMSKTFLPQFNLRIEYSHVHYQRAKVRVVDGIVTRNNDITPDLGQVEFGLVYTFC